MNNENTIQIKLEVDSTALDEALAKERELISLQREYNRLAKGKKPYKPKCWEIIEEMKKGNVCIKFGKKQGEKSVAKQKHFLKWLEKNTGIRWNKGELPTNFICEDTQSIYIGPADGLLRILFDKNFFTTNYKKIPFKYKDFPLD